MRLILSTFLALLMTQSIAAKDCVHCSKKLVSPLIDTIGDFAQEMIKKGAAAVKCDPDKFPTPNPNNFYINEKSYDERCPKGMVHIKAERGNYCIDKFEGSLLVGPAGMPRMTWSPFHRPRKDERYFAISVKGSVPQTMISGHIATKACHNSGKRMCSDHEWLRACRGPKKRTYPWAGNSYTVKDCKDAGKPILWKGAGHGDSRPARCRLHCNDSRPFDRKFEMKRRKGRSIQNACLNQEYKTIARAGEYETCVTPEGVHDMMGNAHEWTDNSKGSFRGGWYMDTHIEGEGCGYGVTDSRLHPGRGQWDMSTGFRCCSNPS